MSVASFSYQCGWVSDGSTFTISLIGSSGDLYQRYTGTPTAPGTITPSWSGLTAAQRPFLRIIAMESHPDITASELASKIIDEDTHWYIDDLKLTFGSDGICNTQPWSGLFRKLTAAAGTRHRADAPYGGLEILGNLVTAAGGQTITIKVIAAIDASGTGIRTQGSTPLRIIKSNGQSNFCQIYCDTGDSFVLDATNPSVTCKVRCWQGDALVTPASHKWYLLEKGAWTLKSTSATYTVTQDDIATFGDVKVECYDSAGQLIASDIQSVNDAEDPYILYPNPSPADAIYYATGGPDKVTFAPKVYDSEGTEVTGLKYYFAVYDSAGNPQNTADATTLRTTYDVPATIARAIREGPIVNITAVQS